MVEPTLPLLSDRDLLFARIALEARLIDRARLAEVRAACLGGGPTTLPDLLIARGWLSRAECEQVERHLERRLREHGGDVRACLTGFADVPGDSPLQDTAADASVAGLPLPPLVATSSAPPEAGPSAPVPIPEQRYERVHLHGSGGVGRVWLARDAALDREVALKELRPDRANNPQLASRFVNEARVTGRLEHPGIVPIYELARHPETGQPFYTMRFIKGRTLTEAVEDYHSRRKAGRAGPLDLQALLGAFLAVCNAIAYAHARGVVHRDLKGLNVVLGEFGEVVVLDWGLAKQLRIEAEARADGSASNPQSAVRNPQSDQTLPGQIVGTPAYMAPEQAEGRVDLIGCHTDVYGLGAMLFEILTGRPPHVGEHPLQLLESILNKPSPRARALEPSVPPALDAVCARAMSRRPEDRYARASDLADDVRRFLADEPVTAWREPWRVRARRWVGRHRTLVTAAAAAVLVAVVLLGGATALLTHANERERQARDLADRNAREARQQSERARQRFGQALDAVELMLTRVSEDQERLRDEPRMELVRRKLLQDALTFYQRFLAEESADPRVRWETGRAHLRVGKIQAALGEKAAAVEHYGRAAALLRPLAEAYPEVPEYRRDLAECHLSASYCQRNQPRLAEQDVLQAVALQERLAEQYPHERAYRQELARSYNELVILWSDHRNQPRKAVGPSEKALALRRQLVRQAPGTPDYEAELSQSLHNAGWLLQQSDKRGEAANYYQEAAALRELLVFDHPDNPQYRQFLGRTLRNLGSLWRQAGRHQDAVGILGRVLDIRQQLTDDFPHVLKYREELAQSHFNLGYALQQARSLAEAEEAYRRALQLWTRLASERPERGGYRAEVGQLHHNLGLLYASANRPKDALAAYREALAVRALLVRDEPDSAVHRRGLAWSHHNSGLVLVKMEQLPEAEQAERTALKIRREVVNSKNSVLQDRINLAASLLQLGEVLEQRKQGKSALSEYNEAVTSLTELRKAKPASRNIQKILAQGLGRRGRLLLSLDQPGQALADAQRAAELGEGIDWLLALGIRGQAVQRLAEQALERARGGEYQPAMDLVNKLAGEKGEPRVLWVKLARTAACSSAAVRKDEKLAAGERDKRAQRYGDRAVELLTRAQAAGHFADTVNRQSLQTDADFAPLRNHPGFRALLRKVEAEK
jgi:serine/threonine-protein kinase